MKPRSQWKLDPDRLPREIFQQVAAPKVEAKNAYEDPNVMVSLGERIAGTRFSRVRQPHEEARARSAMFKLEIDVTNQKYYLKYQRIRFQEDAANKIAVFLTSFQQEHSLEWDYCAWKNLAIAELMLGEFASSPDTLKNRRAAAESWLKEYWVRKQKIARETDAYLSTRRMAASAAILELEMLQFADDPQPWIRPAYSDYANFVRWLNRHWDKFAARKEGRALVAAVMERFHSEQPTTALSKGDLREICNAYSRLESQYPPGQVPISQVVLTVVARRHSVSARLVSKARAERNKRLRSPRSTPEKARR